MAPKESPALRGRFRTGVISYFVISLTVFFLLWCFSKSPSFRTVLRGDAIGSPAVQRAVSTPLTWAYELWESLSNLTAPQISAAFDTLFPPIKSAGGMVHRHLIYSPNSSAPIPNWESDQLWGTPLFLDRITRHQNPLSCQNKKFIVVNYVGDMHGIGSELHCYATYFYWGFVQDRIVAYNQSADRTWTRGKYCDSTKSYDCFFEPLTNCSIAPTSDVVPSGKFYRWTRRVPDWALSQMKQSFVDPNSYCWYWKAMVIAYMCRLNGRTEAAITEIMKAARLPFHGLQKVHFDVSVHVRKGDKIIREMGSISDQHFIRTCLLIRKLLGRNITVFLCTDDSNALEAMKRVPGIRLFWLNYEFRKDNSFKKLAKHGDRATIQALADFALAARSTYFVGLWNSNVERLIMELRGTVYNMASNWYLEMGKMKCVSWTHCRIVHSNFDYAYKGEWL